MMFSPKYNKLLFANFLSYFGDSIFFFVVPIYFFEKTNNLTETSLLTLFSVLPKVLFSMFGHAINMKLKPQRMMVLIDIISGFSFLIVSLLIDKTSVFSFLVIIFFINTLEALYKAPSRTIISSLTNILENEIEIFHKINSSIIEITNILGPVIGVLLYNSNYVGIKGICVLNSISFFIAAKLEFTLNTKPFDNKSLKVSFFQYLFDFKKVILIKQTFLLLLFVLIMNGILGGYKVQLLSYSEVYSDKIYSYFLIFEGIGGALSFLFVFKAIKGWTGANKLFIFLGLVMVLTHYFQNIYTIFMLSMFAGMTITIVGANIYTIILTKFDERLASATVSVTFALGLLAIPIGNWAVSYNTNTPDVFHYLGFMLLITGFYFITMKKEFEN